MLRGGSFAAVCPRPGRRRKHTFSWGRVAGIRPFFTIFADGLHSQSKNVRIMAFFKEFKEFALKGNVMDMAVGVIIGGAFGKIVSSLVNDIIMPRPSGPLLGNTDFQPPAHRPLAHPRPLVAGHARRGGHAHPGCRHLGGEDGRSRGTGLVELRRLHPAVR